MAKQNENLQKSKDELLEFVKNCDLNAQEKEQATKDLLEIFEWEEDLSDNLSALKESMEDLKHFQLGIEAALAGVHCQKDCNAIEERIKRRLKEFEAIENPSKEEENQFAKALKDDEALIKKLENEYIAKSNAIFDKINQSTKVCTIDKKQSEGEKKMSIKEKLGGAFKWAKCKIGVHAGEYSQKEGAPKCYYFKICPDCKELVEKYKHEYGYWDREDFRNPCRLTRKCEYCEYREYKTEHTFNAPPVMEGCQVFDVCSYCGYKHSKGTSHDWRHMDGGRKYCARCGTQEYIN